jgi:hypothetical protein
MSCHQRPIASDALCISATATAASTCPFDTGGSDALNDGVALTRCALGCTGAELTVSVCFSGATIGGGVGGVAFAAIQGLNERLVAQVQSKDLEIAKLRSRLAAIEKRLGT